MDHTKKRFESCALDACPIEGKINFLRHKSVSVPNVKL